VIPYDHRLANLKALSREFDFKIMSEFECKHFDDLESKIMKVGNCAPMFRKWASFFGPYEEFMFFDSDIAITMNINLIFDSFSSTEYDFLYFDTDIQKVYAKEWIGEMSVRWNSRGFNAGAFVSRNGAVNKSDLYAMANLAEQERHKLKEDQVDQPFMNFVADRLPLRIAHVNQLNPDIAEKPWCRVSFNKRGDSLFDDSGHLMPFIHWAGCHYPTMVKPLFYLHYRTLEIPFLERALFIATFLFLRIKRMIGNYNRAFHPSIKNEL
jgi:lipopolysaccharide biosynthesis glycosyltransferase